MKQIDLKYVIDYVEKNIGTFHKQRLENLRSLKLKEVLKRKNPYLYKAKNMLIAQDLVRSILDAHLSSNEETIFGDFLENLARFISEKTTGGRKSSTKGIDLEFTSNETTYLVTIKSGPNWGNSGQIDKMNDNFKEAKRTLRTNTRGIKVVAVNGCCYGIDNNPDKGDYLKLCGQAFWTFISGDDKLYLEIIEPLGHQAKERNEKFLEEYAKVLNLFTQAFMEEFCIKGVIDWPKLVRFNSKRNGKQIS
jgi:hypothetical protein